MRWAQLYCMSPFKAVVNATERTNREKKVADSLDPSTQVKLYSGATVSPGEILVTMGKLKSLLRKGLPGQIILDKLHSICEGKTCADVDEPPVQALISTDLLRKDGSIPGDVREIVRSALQRSESSERLTLRQPYPTTHGNDVIMARVAESVVDALGLHDLCPRSRR